MEGLQPRARRACRVILWAARIISAILVAFILLFVIGESVNSRGSSPSASEWVGLALFPFGVCAGLLVGWRRQILGDAVSLGCLAGFSAGLIVVLGDSDVPPPILVFAAWAILSLIYGVATRARDTHADVAEPATAAPPG